MLVPLQGNQARSVWAADNGCFSRPDLYDDARYLAWLARRRSDSYQCLFATAPDIVGNAVATLERSVPMLARIRDAGYPAALVGQDGMTPQMVPWSDIDALFIGGTTHWKLGDDAAVLVAAAKERGKWVHMGRVNSDKRMMYAKLIGCDSVDGTHLAFQPDICGPRVVRWMQRAAMQTTLF